MLKLLNEIILISWVNWGSHKIYFLILWKKSNLLDGQQVTVQKYINISGLYIFFLA